MPSKGSGNQVKSISDQGRRTGDTRGRAKALKPEESFSFQNNKASLKDKTNTSMVGHFSKIVVF